MTFHVPFLLPQLMFCVFVLVAANAKADFEPASEPLLNKSMCAQILRVYGYRVTESELKLLASVEKLSEAELLSRLNPEKPDPRYLEIGPGEDPLCINCLYIQPEPAVEARDAAQTRGGEPGVVRANVVRLPLADQSVRAITLRHFPFYSLPFVNQIPAFFTKNLKERSQTLEELYRVLAPGGSVYVLTYRNNAIENDSVGYQAGGPLQHVFKSAAERSVYRTADIIRQAQRLGFEVRLIESETHGGLRLIRPAH